MKTISLLLLAGCALPALAATPGALDEAALSRLRSSYEATPSDRALSNALRNADIDLLATSGDAKNQGDDCFSHRVKSNGITDQKSSGRCWLFTGLNVIRAAMMSRDSLPKLELSQNYNFFFDQLEKSNLFLQSVIDTRKLPMTDRKVEWLFQHPLSDGGTYTGVFDNVLKYGVVPKEAMTETHSSSNTSKMSRIIARKLREEGLALRRLAEKGMPEKKLIAEKETMLKDIYRILAMTLGEPPTEFEFVRKDKQGKAVERKKYTPKAFYDEMLGDDLRSDYIMVMNDPSRPYWKLYEIDLDRHAYDGSNWRYANLPIETIKEMAISSIENDEAMYFSCDVGKFLDRQRGMMDPSVYDYESLFGVTFGMDKADRIRTFDSGSSHAMTLVAVDLDEEGKPRKWMVENSWGPGANDGHLIMSDRWFDEYMFRLVVNKQHAPAEVMRILNGKAEMLPPWDAMY